MYTLVNMGSSKLPKHDEAKTAAFVGSQIEFDEATFDFAKLREVFVEILFGDGSGQRTDEEFPGLLLVAGRRRRSDALRS